MATTEVSESCPDSFGELELSTLFPSCSLGTTTCAQSIPKLTLDPSGRVTFFRLNKRFLIPSFIVDWSNAKELALLISAATCVSFMSAFQPSLLLFEYFSRIRLLLSRSSFDSGLRLIFPDEVPGVGSRMSSSI